jgi:hypothetical protein
MLLRGVVTGLWIGLAIVLGTSAAHADRPRSSYRWVDPARVVIAEPALRSSSLIYLNRCAGGCSLGPGSDDSRTDTSSLLSRNVTISEFAHGDAAWDAVLTCVARVYEPFGIVVTDVDPGEAPHFEAIVAGAPSEVGASGIGGVAPFACGVIDNAVTYSFANIYSSVEDLCETVAQETAHAFGLEHEYLCEDPMTYLTGCGPKAFRDVDAPCGEMEPRECQCGGATQNSYRRLLREFDAGALDGEPAAELTVPCEGEECDDGAVEPAGCSVAGDRSSALALGLLSALLLVGCRRKRPIARTD